MLEVSIFRDNETGITTDGTIHKLVIVRVGFYQTKIERWVYFADITTVQYCLYHVVRKDRISLLSKNLFIFRQDFIRNA